MGRERKEPECKETPQQFRQFALSKPARICLFVSIARVQKEDVED